MPNETSFAAKWKATVRHAPLVLTKHRSSTRSRAANAGSTIYDSLLPFGGLLGAEGALLGVAGLGALLGVAGWGAVLGVAGLGAVLGEAAEAAGGELAGRAGGADGLPTGLPTAGMPGMVGDMLGTRGAEGTLGVRRVGELSAPWLVGMFGARGAWLVGFDGEVSDLSATAFDALGGGVEPGDGGTDFVAAGGACDAPPSGAFGATEAPPAGDAAPAGEMGFGATLEPAASGVTARGAGTDALAAAGGGRDPMGEGFTARGGAGIEVRPVEGPGPKGATGRAGMLVAGKGAAPSLQARASTSKLRSVLRPQIGQSQPTSKSLWCASMLCAGARSRTLSFPMAKPAKT